MKKIIFNIILFLTLFYSVTLLAQMPQMGGDFRPNYESYRLDKFIEEGEASYSGELNFSIPFLTVPGRHGHNFDIKISYNSNIRQRQYASWVGLGWNLETGAIERTVNGRTDEPTHNLNFGSLGPGRGNLGGRFKTEFTADTIIDRDVADQYQLLIDGGGMQIIPFNIDMNDSTFLNNQVFLPVQYKPWSIGAYYGSYDEINGFLLMKEDGTKYNYGNFSNPGNGQVEWIRVADDGVLPPHQEYRFPYRWNLNSIQYPDGSTTTIEYEFQNSSNNRLYRRYENVMIDRSQTHTSGVGNFFGKLPSCTNCPCGPEEPFEVDSVYYEYAYPTNLITDTHYLKFKTSSNTGDNTSRNYRLDTLILYEKYTDIELKRIIFHYAQSNNPTSDCSVNYPAWSTNQRLNHNQLTLIGFTIQNGASLPPEGPQESGEGFQKYYFTYTSNPKINIEFISRYVATGGQPEWPGHYKRETHVELAKAWRLKTITLPTGGRYTFEYDSVFVNYSPEGEVNNTHRWNYSSEPMSRLKSKKFEDGFDSPRIWNYSYSDEVIYDPPNYASLSSYVPAIYRYNTFDPWNEYYKWFRGCTIGHRWVKIDYPDGSWKKLYFTSSYYSTEPLESKPDFIEQIRPSTLENIIAISNAGARGLVWKEESGSGSTVSVTNMNYYSFIPQGLLKDRYDYYAMHSDAQAKYQYALRTSIWARLDSTVVTRDGVSAATKFEYNYTIREDDVSGNGLVKTQINKGNNIDRKISYKYAFTKYPGMKDAGMRSQLYSTTITKASNDDESKEFTTWKEVFPAPEEIARPWLPHKIYRWKGSSTDLTAPAEPTGGNSVNVNTFSYDGWDYNNIVADTNANGFVTKYYYSSDPNDPFNNNNAGLRRGYVTGIEYPITSPLLRESFRYDHYGNVIEKADENGNKTKATYDDLGRINLF
jgi:YD repeat-containing protein